MICLKLYFLCWEGGWKVQLWDGKCARPTIQPNWMSHWWRSTNDNGQFVRTHSSPLCRNCFVDTAATLRQIASPARLREHRRPAEISFWFWGWAPCYPGKLPQSLTMRAYAQDIVMDYLRITNGKLKHVNTPFFANGDIETDDSRGELADKASSILMKMMWLAHLARPDLLRVTTWLATKIQKWCSSCDVALFRAICYIESTKSHLLTGYVNDEPEDVFVEFFVDADLCGSSEDCYSTSGAWIQLSGKGTHLFHYVGSARNRPSVSRSTTESETVVLANSLFEEAIPLAELFSTLLQRNVLLRMREDNEACAKVCTAGYSKKLRHLKRVHKINQNQLSIS